MVRSGLPTVHMGADDRGYSEWFLKYWTHDVIEQAHHNEEGGGRLPTTKVETRWKMSYRKLSSKVKKDKLDAATPAFRFNAFKHPDPAYAC